MPQGKHTSLDTPLWTKQFLLITLINLFLYFSFQLVTPTISVYVKSLGAEDHMIGWINGIFTIATLLSRPIAGRSVDRIGRKRVFLLGIFVFILATASYAWITAMGPILLFRYLHGKGWGISSTALYTVASDNIPNERYGEGMGYFTLASNLAMASAPALGLYLIASRGFNIVSLLSAFLAIIALILSFAVKYKKISVSKTSETRSALFEKTSLRPASVMFFVTMSYGALNSFLALHAIERGIAQFGIFFTVMAMFMLIARPAFGRLVDRHGVTSAVLPGMAGIIIAMLILARAQTLTMFLLAAFCYGTGFGAVQSSLQTLAVIHAPRSNLGIANSTFFVGFDSGIGVGSVILGIVASKIGYGQMFQWSIVSVLIALALYFLTGKSPSPSGMDEA